MGNFSIFGKTKYFKKVSFAQRLFFDLLKLIIARKPIFLKESYYHLGRKLAGP